MSSAFVLLAYLGAFLFAVLCIYLFGQTRWYWHIAATVAAIGIGLMPPMQGFQGQQYDIVVGSLVVILLTWGVGEPIYDSLKLPHFHRRSHA
ncbi:MAG TPA: hypothetical protein PKI32_07105 [Opitutales bacterium]|nr:hypothetical protein [Opitutales bacterium]HPT27995.1 hypothetical protein [Bryobacteraceae bacterium]